MTLFRLQDKLDNTATRWYDQYYNKSLNEWIYGKNKKEIYKNLKVLKKPVKASDIDAIIGNSSWTEHKCQACDTTKEALIFLEGKYFNGYEGPNFLICKECLEKALNIIKD